MGALEETLRWGEPSYLTSSTNSGTAVRIHWKEKTPDKVCLFVNCQTDLLERYRSLEAPLLEFEGKRAVLIPLEGPLPRESLGTMVEMAFTYRKTFRIKSVP